MGGNEGRREGITGNICGIGIIYIYMFWLIIINEIIKHVVNEIIMRYLILEYWFFGGLIYICLVKLDAWRSRFGRLEEKASRQ